MHKKKKITWITADYFIDVDIPVVPLLQEKYDICWYILKSYKSNIEIPAGLNYIIIESKYRAKDPRSIFDYYQFLKQIFSTHTDIVYIDLLGTPYFYPVLLNMSNVDKNKIIHAAHNIIPYDGWPQKKLMTWYIDYIFRNVKNFHIFSNFLYKYFIEKYPNKNVFFAPLSLKSYGDLQTDNYFIDNKKCNLLFFGNIKANKNLDLLIKAIKELPEEIQNKVHLTIAGSCDDVPNYLSQIGNTKTISAYFKRIDDTEIPELFLKHQYLVLPYENVAQSGPHMIAYNYNLPVIASDIDGFKERIIDGETGFLFNVNNVEDLKNNIIKAINLNSEEYKTLKSNLDKYVEINYSSTVINTKYINFFNAITK